MTSALWQNYNYNLQIPYVANVYITEWDLSKANINCLYTNGIIDERLYHNLYEATREYREVYVGNMMRDNILVYKSIQDGIRDAKKQLFIANELEDHEILCIKNDAVFVIGNKDLKNTFGNYVFKKKNVYKLMINTSNKLQIFYNYDPINQVDTIDIKGIGEDKYTIHQNGLITFLCNMFYGILNSPIENVLHDFNVFYDDFINMKLPKEYYREFDSFSMYRVTLNPERIYGFDDISDEMFLNISKERTLDINCNLRLLRDIGFVISDMYANKSKII